MVAKSKKVSSRRARKGLGTPTPPPKKVVYLFGAGATQGEVSYGGPGGINLLMSDNNDLGEGISTGVLDRIAPAGDDFRSDKGVDIEKVISLLSASGLDAHLALAEKMREAYFDEVCARLVKSKILEPKLAIALLEMHRNPVFSRKVEVLTGVLTTNHDGLLQAAFNKTFGAVELGFPYTSARFSGPNGKSVPPLLQLHGSFTWTFGTPLDATLLDKKTTYSPNAMWIPPTVLKESKNYPFNKLTGLAYELLSKHCDVFRIIGSSLTQNDWNILTLIFNAQRHNVFLGRAPFIIQLIMPQKDGQGIERSSAYLKNVIPIASLNEGDFTPYEEWGDGYPPVNEDIANPFFYWLKQKINFHQKKKDYGTVPITTTMAKVAGGIA